MEESKVYLKHRPPQRPAGVSLFMDLRIFAGKTPLAHTRAMARSAVMVFFSLLLALLLAATAPAQQGLAPNIHQITSYHKSKIPLKIKMNENLFAL